MKKIVPTNVYVVLKVCCFKLSDIRFVPWPRWGHYTSTLLETFPTNSHHTISLTNTRIIIKILSYLSAASTIPFPIIITPEDATSFLGRAAPTAALLFTPVSPSYPTHHTPLLPHGIPMLSFPVPPPPRLLSGHRFVFSPPLNICS